MVGPLCHSLWIIILNLQSNFLIDFLSENNENVIYTSSYSKRKFPFF